MWIPEQWKYTVFIVWCTFWSNTQIVMWIPDMHREGLLDADEFKAAKRALLGLWAAGRFRGLDQTTAVFLIPTTLNVQKKITCWQAVVVNNVMWLGAETITVGRSAYCFQQGDRTSNLHTAAKIVMSCFVESHCERDQNIMWNPPFNVYLTVVCSFWLVAIRLEHWKADLT